MRLKHLELVGYKTFAAQTEFAFDSGITAIIGPNGSGKSNVADAIRWVLGEQSFSLLRARKSEDMIFSGSEKRARLGMAEATITLDNSEGWLPVEFSEVTLTRRSYRSGENEYLLNGSQVRLRDIADLLGKSGLSRRTYTVIGQGLIDAALSQRPEERRALIEEAAGLTLYQTRRSDALNKLDETKRNVLRVHDLVAEIEPRLKRLKRQAERAEEYEQIRQELDRSLRLWYSFQWKRGREELQQVRTVAQHQLERLGMQQAIVQELATHIAQIRGQQNDLRRQLGVWRRESSALHARSEAGQRELAVAGERRRMLIQQREQVMSEIAALEAERQAQAEQVATAEASLIVIARLADGQQAEADRAQSALDQHRQTVDALAVKRTDAQNELLALRARLTDQQSRLAQLEERQQALQGECATHQAAGQSWQEKLDVLRARLAAADDQLKIFDSSFRKLEEQHEQNGQQIAQMQQRQQALRGQLSALDQRMGRLRDRHDMLTRMREEGTGLYDGVRNVLQAGKLPGKLPGIVGTVAELIHVPQELETAIEVALGGQLQDVVVQSWADAQAAIDYLKRTQGGRATFLPLDTLRAGSPLHVSPMPGFIGLASELVAGESRLRPVIEYLLGRTLICRDLPAARRMLEAMSDAPGRADRAPRSFQIVTPDGEIVRSSGAVTGGTGKPQKQGTSILSREREWRALPGQIQEVEQGHAALSQTLEQATQEEKRLREQAAALLARRNKLEAERRALSQQQDQLQRQAEQAERERAWHVSRLDGLTREAGELNSRQAALRQVLADLGKQGTVIETRLTQIQAQTAQMDDSEWQEKWAACRAAVALTRQEEAAMRADLRGLQAGLHQIDQRLAVRQNRRQTLADELAETERRFQGEQEKENALSVEIQSLASRIEPAEHKLAELERQQAQVEQDERQARMRQQDWESRYGHTGLQLSRQEEQMQNLQRQIKDDLGLVALEMGEDLSGQPLLPLGTLVSSLPDIEVLPEGLEEQVHALRRRLHLLGAVNPDAPAEYHEANSRYEFLSSQAADLDQAATRLRQVIAELDGVMEREFRRTFSAVAREFKSFFGQLFNGGQARLELTNPDDLMNTGIDIMACPPGKRQQGLALLSGGERALTAASLIFAILSVSPTPFCVLDEVDAALDEGNVGRFRTVLKSLAEQTQFVVITHNRYTIEMADIVYGVSMGADGVSCVISHRMNENAKRDE